MEPQEVDRDLQSLQQDERSFVVTDGPSKFDLMLGLFVPGFIANERLLPFTIDNDGYGHPRAANVRVHGITRVHSHQKPGEDGTWRIVGYDVSVGCSGRSEVPLKLHFDSKTRKGLGRMLDLDEVDF